MTIPDYWFLWYDSVAEYRYATMHRYNSRVSVEPTIEQEPITVEECWSQFNLAPWGSPPGTEHDDWFEQIGIPGARSWAESYLGLVLAEQTILLTTNQFPSEDFIDLPYGPVREIVSVTYQDWNGDDVVLDVAEYQLDSYSNPHRLYLSYDSTWPDEVRDVRNSVRIEYVAGYTLADSSPNDWPMPSQIRTGIFLLLGHLWKNREDTTTLNLKEIPIGAKSFLDWHRVRSNFI